MRTHHKRHFYGDTSQTSSGCLIRYCQRCGCMKVNNGARTWYVLRGKDFRLAPWCITN